MKCDTGCDSAGVRPQPCAGLAVGSGRRIPAPPYGVGIRQAIRQRVTGSVSTLTDLADPEATPYGAQMCAFRGLLLTRAVNLAGLDL
jgi:hypothetical protein